MSTHYEGYFELVDFDKLPTSMLNDIEMTANDNFMGFVFIPLLYFW